MPPSVQIHFTRILINNEWHDSVHGKTFPTLNPASEQTITMVQEADEADVDKAVNAAYQAFKLSSPWRQMNASQRGIYLNKLADLIERDAMYLARLETFNSGKLLQDSEVDIEYTIKVFRYYAGWSDKIHGKVIPADGSRLAYCKIEPVGVCAQIIPWNYPLLMLSWKVAPALAAGCTVVLKPSELTPLTALYVGSLVMEAGFPPGVVNIVPGYGPRAGAALVRHPKVDKIAFTGSTKVGQTIAKVAAATCKRVSLELGGKSPLVVTENCNIKNAAKIAYDACFANMGQCCCAGTRTFVQESIYDEFVKIAVELVSQRRVGDPFEACTAQGPQISEKQTQTILDFVESGKTEGAKCMIGGDRIQQIGYFVQPTVFADVTDQMRIAREEIFGPVQQILKYRTLNEVIQRCNDTKYGLAAGIITEDIGQALTFVNSIRAGSVWVNCYDPGAIQVPFGGYKQSGYGRELGEEGIKQYCEVKSVLIDCN